jgi:peroxiredoxin Q/BCP
MSDAEVTLEEGMAAPDFTLSASAGRSVSLAALRGQPVVLYFYPKADTSGCTREACDFQEALPALGGTGLTVIGISPDPMPPIDKFAGKYGLQFPLASDAEKAVAGAYGTWVQKSMYGRKYMGMDRATFLVDREGRIARIWRKVKVPGHAKEVLAAAAAL